MNKRYRFDSGWGTSFNRAFIKADKMDTGGGEPEAKEKVVVDSVVLRMKKLFV